MKQLWIAFLAAVIAGGCQSVAAPHCLQGRRSMRFNDGSQAVAVFRPDGTHDYFVNDKLFSSGKSSFANDTLRAADPICKADYYSVYRIDFVTTDSIRFRAVEDEWAPRKRDLDGNTASRLK